MPVTSLYRSVINKNGKKKTKVKTKKNMTSKVLALGVMVAVMLAAGAARAATWNVSPGQSIQAAIDGASSGDTILINPGTYAQQIIVNKPQLSIKAAEPGTAIIDATGYGVGIHIIGGGDYTLVEGLEVKNTGYVDERGAGIGLEYGADYVTIRNTYSHSNLNNGIQSFIRSAGQTINNHLLVENCRFENNGDSGVKIYGSSNIVVQDSIFRNNGDFGVLAWNYRTPTGYVLDDVQILGNRFFNSGDNIKLDGDTKGITGAVVAFNEIYSGTNGIYVRKNVIGAEVYNNTVVSVGNSGIYLRTDLTYEADVRNNIVWGGLYGIFESDASNEADSNFNNIWNWTMGAVYGLVEGGNSIYADPLFVDLTNGDLRLLVGSPALNAASDGTNIGAYQGAGVPEPATIGLLGLGALSLLRSSRRRREP